MADPSHSSNNVDGSARDASKRRHGDVPPGIAAIMVAVIGVTGGFIGNRFFASGDSAQAHPGPTVTVTVTASPSPTVPVTHLEFALLPGSSVPWCQNYSGTGVIPAGYVLMIFDTPADSSGQPNLPADYSFDGQAVQSAGDRWSTVLLEIGPPNQANFHVDIIGVLSSTPVYNYINSIHAKGSVPWVSAELPPGPRINLPVVTNGQHGLAC
jgi:hypothetical protein